MNKMISVLEASSNKQAKFSKSFNPLRMWGVGVQPPIPLEELISRNAEPLEVFA